MDQTERPRIAVSYKRFSSASQREGDSLQRQTAHAEEWCLANNYELSTVTFEDLGVSAFTGKNAEVGALNAFLQAVENGSIAPGSVLLVENLDRLSRQHWQRGLILLQDIVEAGVNLVTLSDGKMYKAGQPIDFADGIMILVGFQRAHEESVTKSKRLTSAWKSNTKSVLENNRKRSGQIPSWLNLKGTLDSGKFTLIPAKVKVVREVFSRYANGEAASTIAKDLQRREVPALRRGIWRDQTINQLMRNEAPYGHLEIGRKITEHELADPTLIPDGEFKKGQRVIIAKAKDYFPRIIDEDLERRIRFRNSMADTERKASKVHLRSTFGTTNRKTRGLLTGVLRDADGTRGKVKYFKRTISYVSSATNKYIGGVRGIDEIVVDYWPEVVKASQVDTSPEAEGLEIQLMNARETFEFLQSKLTVTPRVLLAAESEVEQLQEKLKQHHHSQGLIIQDVPWDISKMEPWEGNKYVKQVIQTAVVHRDRRSVLSGNAYRRSKGVMVKKSFYLISIQMRNGILLSIGDASVGLRVRKAGGE